MSDGTPRREFLRRGVGAATVASTAWGSGARAAPNGSVTLTRSRLDIVDLLDQIREDTEFEDLDTEAAIRDFCGSFTDFSGGFNSVADQFSTAKNPLRYTARTTFDLLTVLRDTLGLDLTTLEEALEISIDDPPVRKTASKLEAALDKADTTIRTVSTIVPIIGSIFGIVSNGCEYERAVERGAEETAEEAKEDCLICAAMLVLDVFLIYTGGTYRIAFGSTRKIANNLLYRIRGTIGFDAYAVVLKTVYWTIHGTVEGSIGLIGEKLDEIDETLDAETIEYSPSDLLDVGYSEEEIEQLRDDSGDEGVFDIDWPSLPDFNWQDIIDDIPLVGDDDES